MICLEFMLLSELLDSDNRQILDCYTFDTSAEYRPNINQMKILLVRNNNSECNIFPPGVNVNLTVGHVSYAATTDPITNIDSKNMPPFSYTIKDFNYSTTEEITISGLPNKENGTNDGNMFPSDPDYILVEIYSYSEITRIEISTLDEIKSSLSECFYSNSTLKVQKSGFALDFMTTGLCTS